MGDVFGFLFLVGFIYFMLWNTKTDPPKGVPGPSRPDDGVPNRRADGSIVGQVRGSGFDIFHAPPLHTRKVRH